MDLYKLIIEAKDEFRRFMDNVLKFGLEYFRRYYGPYRAYVVSNKDPDGLGRIQVHCPRALLGDDNKIWIFPMMHMAGKNHGEFWPPEEKDTVWIFFDNGDPGVPLCYLGGWYTKNEVDSDLDPKGNNPKKRGWVTPAGNRIIIDDSDGSESILVKQKDGMMVRIKKSKVSIGKDGGNFEPMMKGSTVKQWLTTHTHPHSYGPTGPPKEQFPQKGLSDDTETS